ncbi:NAD-P-binding protein [Trametes meyenii]|nr:NAD-P-binding protein [Trametes meyenii]
MAGIKDAKCILVIGATSGIGRALALALHDLDTEPTVIVSGRRQERLDEISRHGDRIKTARVDINTGDVGQLKEFVKQTLSAYPDLDAIIFSSGIQHIFDFTKPETIDLTKFEDEITTNYISVFRLTVLFLPHLLRLSDEGRPSFIIPVTSSLAIVPKVDVPNYCATKAGLHSLDTSLRLQLANTKVRVIEIVPPLVESELHDHQGTTPALSKFWMPLGEYAKTVIEGLVRGDSEIAAGQALRDLERFEKGKAEALQKLNGVAPAATSA